MHVSTPPRDHWLVLMKGHPATGKSTLAGALARRFAWPLLDKDDIKDHTADLPDGNVLAYTILWAVVRRQLAHGLSVVVDSPLSYPVGYATGRRLADESGAHLLVVEVTLQEDTWRERLERRAALENGHRTAGWPAMQRLLESYAGCWQYPILPDHLVRVDGSLPPHTLCQSIADRMTQAAPAPVQTSPVDGLYAHD